jgi:uncharacterized protein involved in exopolysaccharide biosynthesis
MPSPVAVRASERDSKILSGDSPSQIPPSGANLLNGPDPSIHMLGLPKSYPQLGRWLALAILGGAITAFLLVALAGR